MEFLITERQMQPGGLLSCMKMEWILKKQYIQFIGDYKFNSLFTIGGKYYG